MRFVRPTRFPRLGVGDGIGVGVGVAAGVGVGVAVGVGVGVAVGVGVGVAVGVGVGVAVGVGVGVAVGVGVGVGDDRVTRCSTVSAPLTPASKLTWQKTRGEAGSLTHNWSSVPRELVP